MTYLERALQMLPLLQKGAQTLTDAEALEVKTIYPKWEDLIGTEAKPGMKFLYGTDLYKVTGNAHTFSREWVPGIDTASLYTRIDETHAGTIDDPIPYEGNMELKAGKYYSQGGVTYLCTRDTGIPVYNSLAELVGLYVEVAV